MKKDLPTYLERYGKRVDVRSVEDIMTFNMEDSVQRAPYGQGLFEGIVKDTASAEEFQAIKDTLKIHITIDGLGLKEQTFILPWNTNWREADL